MKREKVTVIKSNYLFKVYRYNNKGLYYIDDHRPICYGYTTLQSAAEYLYYQGYIPEKTVDSLLNCEL